MTGYGVLVRKELREQWRTMRLGVVAIVFVAFGILSPVLAKYTPDIISSLVPADQVGAFRLPAPTTVDAIAQFTKNVGGNLLLAAILLAMTMIASEKERGTAQFVLTKAASRGAFVAAKLTALGATLGIALAIAGAAAYVYTTWLFPAPDAAGFAAMVVFVWLSQVALAAITLFGSALVRSVGAAGAIGLAALLILSIVSALPTIGPYTPVGLQGVGVALAAGQHPDVVVGPILANVALIAAAGVGTWLVFRGQEL